jgi:hypothetical protein
MENIANDSSSSSDRMAGIAFGLLTQVLFACTVWHLFWFLKGSATTGGSATSGGLLYDSVLALQFAVPHSILLFPSVRRRLSGWIGSEFYGCFFLHGHVPDAADTVRRLARQSADLLESSGAVALAL